jgi:hypothetical protein
MIRQNQQEDLATHPYDGVSRRIGTPRCPCWTRWMGITLEFGN